VTRPFRQDLALIVGPSLMLFGESLKYSGDLLTALVIGTTVAGLFTILVRIARALEATP